MVTLFIIMKEGRKFPALETRASGVLAVGFGRRDDLSESELTLSLIGRRVAPGSPAIGVGEPSCLTEACHG